MIAVMLACEITHARHGLFSKKCTSVHHNPNLSWCEKESAKWMLNHLFGRVCFSDEIVSQASLQLGRVCNSPVRALESATQYVVFLKASLSLCFPP